MSLACRKNMHHTTSASAAVQLTKKACVSEVFHEARKWLPNGLRSRYKIVKFDQRRLMSDIVAGRMVLLLKTVAFGGLRIGLKTHRPDHQDRGTGLWLSRSGHYLSPSQQPGHSTIPRPWPTVIAILCGRSLPIPARVSGNGRIRKNQQCTSGCLQGHGFGRLSKGISIDPRGL